MWWRSDTIVLPTWLFTHPMTRLEHHTTDSIDPVYRFRGLLSTYPTSMVSTAIPLTRLGVLETWVLVSRPVFTSLGLGLGLWTSDHEDSVFVTHETWNWDKIENRMLNYNNTTFKVLHTLLEKVFCPPATSAPLERYLATVVCWCGQTGLEWVTTRCHNWSACDATISSKFSCCCTVVISL